MQGIWENFLKIAKEEAGSRVVDTWFKAVSLHEWDAINKVAYLRAPNTFVKDWISTNYKSLIQLHLSRLLNVDNIKVILLDGSKGETGRSFSSTHSNVCKSQDSLSKAQGGPGQAGFSCKGSVVASPKSSSCSSFLRSSKQVLLRKECSEGEQGDREKSQTQETVLVPAKLDRPKTALVKKGYSKKRCCINTNFNFDNFVVGPSNSLAKAAAQAVTDKPGILYNPLFIYGESGLGKTHLLHAVGNSIKNKNKNLSVLYQTADRFVNEFISAIRFDKIHRFQKKYQNIDVLLIDDIQFISNKEQTQEAFFHIFNVLYDSHKQIVFSSDTFPNNISGLAERLRSRLSCGLVTDIHTPSLETKVAILKKKAKQHNEELPDDIAYFIASWVDSNIRELEGALIRVTAFASLTGQQLTIDLVEKVFNRVHKKKKKIVEINDVLKCVSKYYGFGIEDLRSKKRKKELSFARQVAMYLVKKLMNKSLRDIGADLGGRDHSTVLHAIEKIEKHEKNNSSFKKVIEKMEHDLVL